MIQKIRKSLSLTALDRPEINIFRLSCYTLIMLLLFSLILVSIPPVYADNETWINPYTNVTWDGVYSFFSAPVKVWDGSDLVDYVIRRNNETSILLKTPRCSYMIGSDHIDLFKPNGTTSVGAFSWILEKQDPILKTWGSPELASTSVGYNYTHVWETWTFKDGSERILAISTDNKQTVSFTPSENGSYRVLWEFSSLQATKTRLRASVSQIKGEQQLLNFEDTSIEFHDEKERIVRIEWSDIDKNLYRDLRYDTSSCLLTYGNVVLDAGEVWTIDPTTFTSEATLDGYLRTKGYYFPPPEDDPLVNTDMTFTMIGKSIVALWYYLYRSFTSFNTSVIDDDAMIDSVKLCMTGRIADSDVTFDAKLYSGFYGDSLDGSDWNACPTYRATIPKSCFEINNYFEIGLDPDVVNKTGRTQFRYIPSDEILVPEEGKSEILAFYTGDDSTRYPTLIVDVWTEEEQEEEQYWTGSTGTTPLDEITQIIPAPPKVSISTLGLWIVVGGVVFIGGTAIFKKLNRPSKRKPRGVRRSPSKSRSFKPKRTKKGRYG